LPAADAIDDLLQESTVRDFVADAFAALASSTDVSGFVDKLGQLRVWSREPRVKMK